MRITSGLEIDGWLQAGGLVVAASERAARALAARFHRARRAECLGAWPAPAIFDWQSFVLDVWEKQTKASDGRLVLNSQQEHSIWVQIAGSSQHMATLLEGPRHRMANLAMEAHKLLCSYAPQFLKESARVGWPGDARHFSSWLAAFDASCLSSNLLSSARLPLELIQMLEGSAPTGLPSRPPLLLAGFDRILPIQRRFFDAWGQSQEAAAGTEASEIHVYSTSDTQSELAACALWCKSRLAVDPQARLLVVTQDLAQRRGEIERAFLSLAEDRPDAAPSALPFEFSLGIPLSQVGLARGAQLMLRWLTSPIEEHEVDWLLSTGHAAADSQESVALQTYMRTLRRRGLERTEWSLNAFLSQRVDTPIPESWAARMIDSQRRFAEHARLARTPIEWAELVPQLLQTAGWPGSRPLASTEFQALRRWRQTVESSASLGFDGRRIRWQDFLSALARGLDETLFAPESHDAPIQIAGPAESAGLTADGIWFMGASENAWPASGSTHPLLPLEVQREAKMPHATAQLDWELALSITHRLLRSAPQICFSYARQSDDVETRASRLVLQSGGAPQPLPAEFATRPAPDALTVPFEDASRVPFPPGKVEGGSSVLTYQSQCPFKAFATARLAAQGWDPAEAGLTAAQRGRLLHAVLHIIWGGQPQGIRTLNELRAQNDRKAFVSRIVQDVFEELVRSGLRERMPERYLELEQLRLIHLITEWLDYEATRAVFEVMETEAKRVIQLAGITLDVRLDRIDLLNDGSLLVIDYKTGQVTPKAWELPRPDDVQLPLYGGFALEDGEELGGLVFAKVRSGDQCFAGHVGDAKATLISGLSSTSALVKNNLSGEMLIDWRDRIEQLARDFLSGRAEVDPRDYPKTCEHCGLETLCRISESRTLLEDGEGFEGNVEAVNA